MATTYNIVASDFIRRYINLVKETDINEALSKNGKTFRKLLNGIPAYKFDYSYATDKWTLKEVLQHVIDAERVFSFRAIWFARKDPSPLPGFEENDWAAVSHGSTRNWEDMIDEFRSLRKATKFLFASFTDEELNYTGTANNNQLSVAAIGFLCAGHIQHHMNIINERYL
ncbi:MAG: DinB family protein [Chitinophagaceae bacterium]